MRIIRHISLFTLIVFIVGIFCACCPLCRRPNHQWFPVDGVWYCEALQAQLAFDEKSENYMMKDGEKVTCSWINDPGACYFFIICSERNHPEYKYGQTFFKGTVIHIDDESEYVLEGENGVKYVFVRIG